MFKIQTTNYLEVAVDFFNPANRHLLSGRQSVTFDTTLTSFEVCAIRELNVEILSPNSKNKSNKHMISYNYA